MFKYFVVTLLFSYQALAADGFHCIPSLRQTRLQVLKKENVVELLVVNPDGYEFMPQFDGPSSAFSLAFNKMQAGDLKGLGDYFVFSWDAKNCDVDSEQFVVNCRGEARTDVRGIKSFGVTTAEIREKTQNEVYEKRRFRLNVEKENNYFVSLEFYTPNCEKFEGKP